MSTYRYVTALDVAYSLFSPKSLTHVRSILAKLCGGRDYQERNSLYRFPLPSTKAGNRERVYTLGATGREAVESCGIPVDWYYRPSKTGRLSHSHLAHQLLLTRFVVCASYFTRQHPEHSLVDVKLCYELERQIPRHGGEVIVPDAWLHFERVADGVRFPVLVEIDRGSEFQERYKNHHVRGRIEFIRSGDYARVFGTPAVIIAYATTGQVQEYAETRRKTMCTWTLEVLRELELGAGRVYSGLRRWSIRGSMSKAVSFSQSRCGIGQIHSGQWNCLGRGHRSPVLNDATGGLMRRIVQSPPGAASPPVRGERSQSGKASSK
jgi:hypothetical protein